jgi:penicillin-binding protein 2
MEVDARRRPVRVVGRDNATPGRKLILSLDAGLQKFTTQLFASKGFKGGAVVIDPRNGEILSIVSSPTFDQKVFQGGISQVEWDALMNDERNPMINRAIGSAYAPGSTFKIVTALAAQQEGKFSPYGPIFCGGGYRLGRHLFKCLGRHGAISFEAAMAGSCNTYFSTLGRAVGREKLVEVAKSVGLGVRTGLEIGGESRGDLPTEGWLENRSNRKPAVWYGGDAVNTSLGQGAVNTTPIQMANLAALVANNGTSYVPHLVRAVKDPTGTKKPKPVEPVVAHKVDAPPEFWATMKRSLVRVISNGTARSAQISGVTWGGKTGSAEHRRGKKTHGWFVGFAPAENPKIAICVMVEAAGHGGDVAAPIARDIVNRYLTKAEAKKATSASAAAALSRAPAAR